jgi:carbon starvation protein CstA
MITFIVSIVLLVVAYFTYGKVVERIFGASEANETPVKRMADGVDYIEMKPWRMFVVQLLNIAGLGPIFGAVLGAAYGPMAYVWIVFGAIFMGATHDYFSGMLSLRLDGKSYPDIVGKYLGNGVKKAMTVVSVLLLFAVGASFVTGPAGLLANLTGWNMKIFFFIIFIYYILATLLPVNQIIGRIYPYFGAFLIIMAVMVSGVMLYKGFTGGVHLPELTVDTIKNMHSNPTDNILFPMLFIVISCGAISGFHATQSPIVSRCMVNEKSGRSVFYGAMISESIIAMIWATAAIAYFGGVDGLNTAAASGQTPAIMVNEITRTWLGKIGAIFAIIGVVVLPITTGDTAFRSLRLVVADALKFSQKPLMHRLYIAVPVFVIAFFLCGSEFSTLWKFVGITNQTLAAVFMWTIAAYLVSKDKSHWMASIPAAFLTVVVVDYFLTAPYASGGLHLPHIVGHIAGITVSLGLYILFFLMADKIKEHSKK